MEAGEVTPGGRCSSQSLPRTPSPPPSLLTPLPFYLASCCDTPFELPIREFPTLKATSSGSRFAEAQTPLRRPLSNRVWSYVRSAAKEFESLLAQPRRTIASSPPTPMSPHNWPIQLRKPSSTFTMLVPSASAP